MNAVLRLLRRLAHWWRFRANDAELHEELAFHRDAIERQLLDADVARDAAQATARRAMGNETRMREASRAVWLPPFLEGVWQDLKGTLRSLGRSPAFTTGVILTFALGLGANAAMFSLIDRLMFRPPPFTRDPATVHRVYLYRTSDGIERQTGGIYARFRDIAELSNNAFSAHSGFVLRELAVGIGPDAREAPVAVVSAGFFAFFDAPPAAGRYYTAAEDSPPQGAAVLVLSYGAWQTMYGGRTDAIGKTLHIGARVYTIIGVAPRGFVGLWPLTPPVAFIPVTTYAASAGPPDWASTYGWAFGLDILARRRPNVPLADASADLTNALVQSYSRQDIDVPAAIRTRNTLAQLRPRAVAGPLLEERGPERSSLAKVALWVAGVTVIVLLIATANVASLLVARSLTRRREVALRIALGVSRARLLSQAFAESLVLAVSGSALGVLVAMGMSAVLRLAFLPGTEPAPVATDPRTLGYIALVTLAAGLVTGLLPVLQLRHLSIVVDLKSGGRSGVGTAGRSRARVALLVVQGALSLVLLVGAGLFVQSLRNVNAVRLGFDADSVLVVETRMRDVTLDSAHTVALRNRLLGAATTVAGITHASLQFAVPFGGTSSWPVYIAGVDSTWQFGEFALNAVSPDYFKTMGTRILRGRGIAASDVSGSMPVMVVEASMAAVLWPHQDPIGQCVRMLAIVDQRPCWYVVGVAEDIHAHRMAPDARSFYYYVPATQLRPQEGGLFVRTPGEPERFIAALRERLQREMPGASYVTVTPLAENITAETRAWTTGATLFSVFGILALVLAGVGWYSVIAYHMAQRRQELAVRAALGATAASLVRLVVSEGVRFAALGVTAGVIIALVAARWIAPLLFNQSARDPAVFGYVALVLFVVAGAASAIPAVQGARADPSAALKAE